MAAPGPLRRVAWWWAVGAAAFVVLATLAVVTVGSPSVPRTTYAATPGGTWWLVGAGGALLAAALVTWAWRPGSRLVLPAAVIALCWLAHGWVGWAPGPDVVQVLAAALVPFGLPALVLLAVAATSSGSSAGTRRWLLLGSFGAAVVISLGLLLVRDPAYDLWCWQDCQADNPFLWQLDVGAVRGLTVAWWWVSALVGVAGATAVAWGLRAAPTRRRRSLAPVAVPAAAALLAQAAYAAALLGLADERRVDPIELDHGLLVALFTVRGVSLLAIGAGLTWSLLRERQRAAEVRRLSRQLGSVDSVGVEAMLAARFADPSLRVGFWQSTGHRWLSASGRPMGDVGGSRRASTTLHRGGRPVAMLLHSDGAVDPTALPAQLGPAGLLALDNERLRAEVLARLTEVHESRARVVVAGDEARRRLERDLHDGAQQRLLSVLMALRLARTETADDHLAAPALDDAVTEAMVALAELRELAHGIFPAVLDEAGLVAALATLAERSPVPLEVRAPDELPLDGAVARAAYLVVAAAVERRRERPADHAESGGRALRVEVGRHGDTLHLGLHGAEDLTDLALQDRVGALGGTLSAVAGRVEVRLPCASS